jgi:hypothetical protein
MPEQPADPLHYDMKVPPEPDPEKQRGPEKPPSDHENASNNAKDTNVVRGDATAGARDQGSVATCLAAYTLLGLVRHAVSRGPRCGVSGYLFVEREQ